MRMDIKGITQIGNYIVNSAAEARDEKSRRERGQREEQRARRKAAEKEAALRTAEDKVTPCGESAEPMPDSHSVIELLAHRPPENRQSGLRLLKKASHPTVTRPPRDLDDRKLNKKL